MDPAERRTPQGPFGTEASDTDLDSALQRSLSVFKENRGASVPQLQLAEQVVEQNQLPVSPSVLAATEGPQLQASAEEKRIEHILRNNPAMARYFETPENVGFSAEEIETLDRFRNIPEEDTGWFQQEREGWTALTLGAQSATQGLIAFDAGIDVSQITDTLSVLDKFADITPGDRTSYRNRVAELREKGELPPGFQMSLGQQFVFTSEEERGKYVTDLMKDKEKSQELYDSAARLIVEYSKQMPPGEEFSLANFHNWTRRVGVEGGGWLVIYAATAMLTGGTGVVPLATAQGIGSVSAGIIEEGGDLTTSDAPRGRIVAVGLGMGVAERVLGPVARAAGGPNLMKMLAKPFTPRVEDALKIAVRSRLTDIGVAVTQNAVEEGVQEIIQTIMQEYGVNGEIEFTEEFVWQLVESGVAGAMLGGSFGGAMAVPGATARRQQKLDQLAAEKMGASIEEMNANVAATTTRDTSPKAFRQFLQASKLDRRSIYFDAEQLQAFADRNPGALSDLGLSTAKLTAAIEQGVKVPVSLDLYMENVPGRNDGLAKFAADNATLNPTTMSRASATKIAEETGQTVEQVLAEERTRLLNAQQLADAVARTVADQLVAAGTARPAATMLGRIHGAFLNTMSDRYGSDRVFGMFNLQTTGTGQRGQRIGRRMEQAADLPENTIIREDTGEPVILYHGTRAEFDSFKPGGRVFMTSRRGLAVEHATRPGAGKPRVLKGTAALAKPLMIQSGAEDPDTFWLRNSQSIESQLESGDFDGVMVYNDQGELMVIANDPASASLQEERDNRGFRVFKQSKKDRRTPAKKGAKSGVAMPNTLASAADLALNEQFANGRDFKVALQGRVTEDLSNLDDETAAKLEDYVFEDALEAAQDNQNAIGWYDRAVTAAKTELAKLYPEIAEGGEAEFAFIWALAVTSNGLKVNKNFELAADAYEAWKRDGQFPKKIGVGTAAKQIDAGLAMYHRMIQKFGSWEAARDFMIKEQEVREIESLMADEGISISGEGKGEVIRGAGILGPKIGNGFFSNLYGHFDALTMDRWLMRSVGRWRGTLIKPNPAMEAQKRDQIRAVLTDLGDNARPATLAYIKEGLSKPKQKAWEEAGLDNLDLGNDTHINELAVAIATASTAPAWRNGASDLPGGDDLRKLGNALNKYLDGQVEAPGGAAERTFLRKVFNGALERLKQEPGMEALTMADLQALLWYPEKLLYESAKKKAGQEVKSYADDEAPDYGNAARELVRNRLGRAGGAGGPERGSGVRELPDQQGDADGAGGAGADGDAGGYAVRATAPLEGAPNVEGASGPDPQLIAVADAYAAANGIDLRRQAEFVPVDPARGKRIADAYEAMKHDPNNPAVKEAYANLIRQTTAQYQALIDAGYEFTFFANADDPYKGNPWNAMRDLRANKKMAVYGTYAGYGTEGITDSDLEGNPMLADTGLKWKDQNGDLQAVTANDLFRAVHDAFGHGLEGAGFRARGEENAWQAHVRLFTGSAIAAITTETRGQNSWLNYGPYGESNRTAKLEDTVFAEQKTGLMPEWTWTEGRAGDMPAGRSFNQGPRGTITFPEGGVAAGTTFIELTKDRNLSTFIHESGHFFLEAFQHIATLPDAPQAMKDDLATINEWLGRAPDDTSPFTTAQQEQWAEGFEKYAMEGVAPSASLKAAFARFSRWLRYIYQMALNIGDVPLNDEVRQVMDRMLATDAELQEVRAETGTSKAFDAPPPGMSQEEFDVYNRLAERNDAEAEGRLLKRMMAKVRRARTKEYKKQVKEAKQEISEELGQRREYRVINALGGRDPDSGISARFDKKELVENFGPAILDELSSKRYGVKRNLYADDGVPLAVVAETFGYRNAYEMINALRSTEAFDAAVQKEAELQVEAELGDPNDEVSIREEAEAAIKNPAQQEQVAREAAALRRAAGGTGPTRWQEQQRDAKAAAEAAVDALKVSEVLAYRGFLQDAKRHAQTAQRELASIVRRSETGAAGSKAALAKAADAKTKQLRAEYMYRIAREKARKIEASLNRYRKLGAAAEKSVGTEYMDQIEALLAKVQLKKGVSNKAAVSLFEFHNQLMDSILASGVDFDPEVMMALEQKHYTLFTMAEMEALIDTVDNLLALGRAEQKARLADELVDIKLALDEMHEAAGRSRYSMRSLAQLLTGKKVKPTPESKTIREERQRGLIADTLLSFRNANMVTDVLDSGVGTNVTGPFYRFIKRPIDKASQLFERRLNKAMKEQDELIAKFFGGVSGVRDMRRQRKIYPELDGAEYTKLEIIAMALHVGTASNWDRLTNAGAGSFEPSAVQAVLLRELSETDWRGVQAIWDHIGRYGQEIDADYRQRVGRRVKLEPAKLMIEGAPPFVVGGYHPVAYDGDFSGSAEDIDRAQLLKLGRDGAGMRAATTNGFSKGRVKRVTNKRVLLDFDQWRRHEGEVLRDLTIGRAIFEVGKIVYHNDFQSIFRQFDRLDLSEFFKQWLDDVAIGSQRGVNMVMSRAVGFFKTQYTLSILGFNMGTGLMQISGPLSALGTVPARDLVVGTLKVFTPGGQTLPSSKSDWMREVRSATFDSDMVRMRAAAMNSKRPSGVPEAVWRAMKPTQQAAAYAAMILIKTLQFHVADKIVWNAQYSAALRKGMSEEQAIESADKAVTTTQGSGLVQDQTAWERGRLGAGNNNKVGTLITIMSPFMSFAFQQANTVITNSAQMRVLMAQGRYMKMGALFGATYLAVMLPMILSEMRNLEDFLPDDEDDDNLPLYWAQKIGLMHTEAVAGWVPGVGSLFGPRGFGSNGAVTEMVTRITGGAVAAAGGTGDDMFTVEGLTDPQNMNDFITGMQTVTGLSSLHRPTQLAFDFFDPELDEEERAQRITRFFTGLKLPVETFE